MSDRDLREISSKLGVSVKFTRYYEGRATEVRAFWLSAEKMKELVLHSRAFSEIYRRHRRSKV